MVNCPAIFLCTVDTVCTLVNGLEMPFADLLMMVHISTPDPPNWPWTYVQLCNCTSVSGTLCALVCVLCVCTVCIALVNVWHTVQCSSVGTGQSVECPDSLNSLLPVYGSTSWYDVNKQYQYQTFFVLFLNFWWQMVVSKEKSPISAAKMFTHGFDMPLRYPTI